MAIGIVNVPGSAVNDAHDLAQAAYDAAVGAQSRKQDKLTGQPGQVAGFRADGSAAAVDGWSNPNLIINWDFRKPVNRMGKTEYNTSYRYIIDRWYSNGLQSVTVHDGYITATDSSPDIWRRIWQKIDNPALLNGLTVTMSMICRNTGVSTLALYFRYKKEGI